MLGDTDEAKYCGGGLATWTETDAFFEDPNEAVYAQMKRAEEYVTGLMTVVKNVKARVTH